MEKHSEFERLTFKSRSASSSAMAVCFSSSVSLSLVTIPVRYWTKSLMSTSFDCKSLSNGRIHSSKDEESACAMSGTQICRDLQSKTIVREKNYIIECKSAMFSQYSFILVLVQDSQPAAVALLIGSNSVKRIDR